MVILMLVVIMMISMRIMMNKMMLIHLDTLSNIFLLPTIYEILMAVDNVDMGRNRHRIEGL